MFSESQSVIQNYGKITKKCSLDRFLLYKIPKNDISEHLKDSATRFQPFLSITKRALADR